MLIGGAGRANGFGGPVAPADSIVFAEGDGGGSTTPACPVRIGVGPAEVAVPLGDESAAVLAPSDCSLGICTLSLGRFASAPPALGSGGTEDVDDVRCGGGGNAPPC